jgi:hypothetical protein
MSPPQPTNLTLDRRLLEHPRAYHLRRMRAGIWLYLDLLARLAGRPGSLELEPAAVGREMGLPEGTIRSWLGHLRKGGYLKANRRDGAIEVTLDGRKIPADESPRPMRVHSATSLALALGESGKELALEAALRLYPKKLVDRALEATIAVPQGQIRHSRTGLFLYLLKQYAEGK